LHGRLPEPLTWNKRIIVHRRQICEFSPYHHPVPSCSSQVSQACRPASTAGRLMGGVSVRSPPCKFSRRSALKRSVQRSNGDQLEIPAGRSPSLSWVPSATKSAKSRLIALQQRTAYSITS
jgi:hypothetical protein